MKVKSSVKRICKHCRLVKRRKVVRIICKENPRHKQRQGFATWTGELRAAAALDVRPVPALQRLSAFDTWAEIAHNDLNVAGRFVAEEDDGT